MKYRYFSETIPLCEAQLFVVVGTVTGQQLYDLVLKHTGKEMKRLIKEGCEQSVGCVNRKENVCVVWLKTLNGVEGKATLAHEALHFSFAVCKQHMGIIPSSSSEEVFAYYCGWLVETVLSHNWRA